MEIWLKMFWVGVGGFLGANARYWLGGWAAMRFGTAFPWGTLLVNVTGSFILGLVVTMLSERVFGASPWRLMLAIGFLGAYTTFSTFAHENMELLQEGSLLRATANIMLSVLASLFAVWIGMKLASSG